MSIGLELVGKVPDGSVYMGSLKGSVVRADYNGLYVMFSKERNCNDKQFKNLKRFYDMFLSLTPEEKPCVFSRGAKVQLDVYSLNQDLIYDIKSPGLVNSEDKWKKYFANFEKEYPN